MPDNNAAVVATPDESTVLNPVITPEKSAEIKADIERKFKEMQGTPLTPSASADEWFIDDGIKGTGKRPDYLLPKFTTQASQAKAYTELEKKFGEFAHAPDKYELPQGINPEEGVVKEFLDFAKQSNASQTFVAKALDFYSKAQQPNGNDPEKELQKLGANAKEITDRVTSALRKHVKPEEMQWVEKRYTTAEDVMFLDRILSKIPQASPISPMTQSIASPASEAQILAEASKPENFARFMNDDGYRNEIRQRIATLKGIRKA